MSRQTTLASQLQPRLVITVAVMAVLVVLSTLFAASTILYGQLDAELDKTQVRQQRGPEGGRVPGVTVPGMREGTLIAAQTETGKTGRLIGDGAVSELTTAQTAQLLSLASEYEKRTVTIDKLGTYRVIAKQVEGPGDSTVVVGLPVAEVDHALLMLGAFAGGVGLVAIGATSLVTRAVLGRATKPLVALSATADQVSGLDLTRGTVEVPRVHVADERRGNEVTRLSHAFNHMLGRVESALGERERSEAKLRQFVADASHELRNPLAAIRGYAELAERAPDASGASHALGRISAESKRMTKLVNDLLLLARLDADAKVEVAPVDVVEVALNAVSDAQAASREHRWQLDLPEESIEVMADADQLHQVMVNLLSNARTHTPPGTTVTTSVRTEAGQAVIRVADNGPGIDPETQERVFERFIRADDSRAHNVTQSTGLGLAIVRAVVQGFHGEATVESRPGNTVFSVRLPLRPYPATPPGE